MIKLFELLKSWGPPGALVMAALDSAGVPLPAGVDALLIGIGIASPQAAMLAALLATVGSAAGCLFLFYIARAGGQAYLARETASPRAQRFAAWFRQYGLVTVFIPTLLPVPLPTKVFVISAGALGVAPLSFLLVVLAARVPRYFALAWLGAQLGEDAVPWLKAHALHFGVVAALLFLGLYLLVKWKGRQARDTSEA